MNYQDCRQLLAEMGIWAHPRKRGFRPTLRWGHDQNGKRIRGTYLNETDTDLAYFTLNSACRLKEDANLWVNLPQPLVAEVDKKHRNIYPVNGKEREALHQLFMQPMKRK